MPYQDFQDDLFGSREGKRKPIKKVFPGHRFLPYIKIPFEYTVITAVVVMILVIVAYALGFEKGKNISSLYGGKGISMNDLVENDPVLPDNDIEPIMENESIGDITDAVPDNFDAQLSETETEKAPKKLDADSGENEGEKGTSLYQIQLASFKNAEAALRVVEQLRKDGIDAGCDQKGDWYQVYASGYKSIEEAKTAQGSLCEEYDDCYVRKIR